jgi:NitT/TauT family transport system substrate-binding protein
LSDSSGQTKTISRRRRALATVAALVTVASLTACGQGAAGTEKTADGKAKITVLRSNGAIFEPLYIAEQQGYFKEANLEVTIKAGAQDTSQNAPSVLNNEAQFAMTDSSGFLKAAAQGMPLRIVTGLQSATTKTAPTDGLLVKQDSAITDFGDLPGKTVGLSALGGTIQFICEYLVQRAGGDPAKVNFVSLPTTSLNDAVSTGKVDAVYSFATFYAAGKTSGLRSIGNGMNEVPGIVQGLLFSSQSYLSANGDAAKRFIDAIAKAIDYANAHPEAVRAIDKQYTKVPADYIDSAPTAYYDKQLNTKVMRTVITKMTEFGLLTKAPTDADLYWDKAPTVASGN